MPGRSPLRVRPLSLSAAVLGTGALIALSAAPGSAATVVARADAVGLVLTVASTPTDSGAYAVTNDGTAQTSTGDNKPRITVLGDQPFLSAGTLAQDATTKIVDGRGTSAACAGLAGDGATLASAGSGGCLTPGDNLSLSAGTLDLSDVKIVQSDALGGLDQQLQDALQPILDQILPAAQGALQQVLTTVGNPDITLDLGAIQSQCTAGPGTTADGDSDLADVALDATIAGMSTKLVALPVHPAPNTKVLTNLSAVVTAIQDALNTQLTTALNGAAGPLAGPLSTALDAVKANVLDAVSAQLAPLEKNVLDGTLNKQVRSPGAIEITALDLKVLPAAQQFGVDLVSTQIGKVSCGPSGRIKVTEPQRPPRNPNKPGKVPTVVPSGLESGGNGPDSGLIAGGALALLGAVSAAAGVRTFRRAGQA